MERNVFLYWVGYEYKLITILRNLIYLHSKNGKGYKLHLITDKNIKDYVPDLPDYFYSLQPAHQADFVRVNVVCNRGGIWLDSDTLIMDKLDSLFDIIESKQGFFIKENNEILCNGVFGSQAKTPLMIEWKTIMMQIFNVKKQNIGWSEVGCRLLQGIFNTNKSLYGEYVIFEGLDNLYPINYDKCIREFIETPYHNYKNIVREYQPLVVLVNSVYKALESKTKREILEGNMPLNYFLNKSLENLGIIKNKLFTDQTIFTYNKKDYISSSIINYKCWEPFVSNIFNTLLQNNESHTTVVDIGCNVGYYSLLSAKDQKIKKVYSIDGNITNIKMLDMTSTINDTDKISAINMCVSEAEGYYIPGNKDTIDRNGNIGGLTFVKTSSTNGVISTTIDMIINKYAIDDILIMKVDIEGGELDALKGCTKTLKTNIIKNIILELSPKFNNDSKEILTMLINSNYDIYNIPNRDCGDYCYDKELLNNVLKTPVRDIDSFIVSVGIQTNILAVKKINTYKKYIIVTDWLKTYITKECLIFCKNLESYGWEIVYLSELVIDSIKSEKATVLCVTYGDFDITRLKCDNLFLVYKVDDIGYSEICDKCIGASNLIIGPYQYLFNNPPTNAIYPKLSSIESLHISYSAVNEFYEDIAFNPNPINKVLVSGAIDPHVYPLRYYASSLDETDVLQHPSYNKYKHDVINEKFYKKMNEYICCFTDVSAYKYILLKVFEICSVGSLLLVEDSIAIELNKLGFYDTINCVFCNKENLKDKIQWILSSENRKAVDCMRKLGMNLVRSTHNTKQRSIQFNDYISSILK